MSISVSGLVRYGADPELYEDRRGFGILYRVPQYGANAGEFLCQVPGVGTYSAFKNWIDLPYGSLMRATDRQGSTFEFTSDGYWVPQGGQYTGTFNLGSSRNLTADDNGSIVVNQLGTSRTLTVLSTLPQRFSMQVIQGSTGTITFAAGGGGIQVLGASMVTGGPGKLLTLRRIDSATFILY